MITQDKLHDLYSKLSVARNAVVQASRGFVAYNSEENRQELMAFIRAVDLIEAEIKEIKP